jgi:hypothetical protein
MSVRFRPYDPERRFVWPVPIAGGGSAGRWVAIHRAPPDWKALFTQALDLMMIDARSPDTSVLAIGDGSGRLCWRGPSSWTIIDVDLRGMSEKKQAVVKAALLKAARYAG